VVISRNDRAAPGAEGLLGLAQYPSADLSALMHQHDLEMIYTNARAGTATLDPAEPGTSLAPLFEAILRAVPGPCADLSGGFQMLVTSIDYDEYRGRTGIGRIARGRYRAGDQLVRIDRDGAVHPLKGGDVYAFEGLKRLPVDEALAGDIVAISGLEDV